MKVNTGGAPLKINVSWKFWNFVTSCMRFQNELMKNVLKFFGTFENEKLLWKEAESQKSKFSKLWKILMLRECEKLQENCKF